MMNNLLSLDIAYFNSFKQTIECVQLPESLTHIKLSELFELDAILKSVKNSLEYTFHSFKNTKKLKYNDITNSTTILIFENTFNQDITIGLIGQNVYYFDQILNVGYLPNSITKLIFPKFNKPINCGVLPKRIIYLHT